MKLKLKEGVSLPVTHFSLTVKKKFRKALQEWFFANGFSFFGGSVNYQKKAKYLQVYPFDKTLTYCEHPAKNSQSIVVYFEEDTCLGHIKYPNSFLGLPEHWYIRVTEHNVEVLNDYLKTHKDRYEQYRDTWYVYTPDLEYPSFFHSDSLMGAAHSVPNPRIGYVEVTTEMVENYMKKWNQIQSLKLIDEDWIVAKDVKLGDKYVGDVRFQKSEVLDKSWLEVKKMSERKAMEQLAKQCDLNKDGNINDAKKEQYLKEMSDHYDSIFKMHTDFAIEAGTHKTPDKMVTVIVKEGSIIISPEIAKGFTIVKATHKPGYVNIGDLKNKADAFIDDLKKRTEQERISEEEFPKTLDNVNKLNRLIGIDSSNKDCIYAKAGGLNFIKGGRMFFYNTQDPRLKYTPEEMLSDWKNNKVKPLD